MELWEKERPSIQAACRDRRIFEIPLDDELYHKLNQVLQCPEALLQPFSLICNQQEVAFGALENELVPPKHLKEW